MGLPKQKGILDREQQSRSQVQFELQQTVATNKQETKQLKQSHFNATEELNANHTAELDRLTRQHAAETLKSNNAFLMLEQRLDAVAQSHMVSEWCGCQRRNAKTGTLLVCWYRLRGRIKSALKGAPNARILMF